MNDALDHRALAHDLDIFTSHPLAGAGLPLWHPGGAVIRDELERLARDLARADGCQEIHTPVLGKRALFERSGHWEKFADDMFPPMQVGGDELVLRPANCPHHALVYGARRRSWRELPVRYHELAPMFRAERSGVLSGLSRVRQISLDDTHVFARPDQVAGEVARALRTALRAQEVLGLPVDYVRLSRRGSGPSYLGDNEWWHNGEQALRVAAAEVLGETGHDLSEAEGEAAFYGPKLDLQVKDGRGQEETIATVQLDGNQPERFDLTYDAADGSRERVVMIHRGTVGSMERVTAALLERYQGRLPLWIAPVQLCIIPVGADQDLVGRELADSLLGAGLRPRLELGGSIGARIRASRVRRDRLIAVIGPAETAGGVVQVNDPLVGVRVDVSASRLVEMLRAAYDERREVPWAA